MVQDIIAIRVRIGGDVNFMLTKQSCDLEQIFNHNTRFQC